MQKETPLGMRIGESAFCVGYLIFAFAAGSIFTARANASGNIRTCCWHKDEGFRRENRSTDGSADGHECMMTVSRGFCVS